MIARRLRLSFLDVRVTESVLPRVAELMAEELGWNKQKKLVCFCHFFLLYFMWNYIAYYVTQKGVCNKDLCNEAPLFPVHVVFNVILNFQFLVHLIVGHLTLS